MAFFEKIFVRRLICIWKHCPRRPRVVTRDFYHQQFLVWRRADIIAEIYSFEAICPVEKPVFLLSDLG